MIVVINRQMPDLLSRTVLALAGGGEPADPGELRDYGVGAQILAELGVHDMELLTNSHHTPVALSGYGLNIVREHMIG